MAIKTQLQKDCEKYIKFLTNQNLLTDEHAYTVSLARQLAAEWENCDTSTQRAAISKEIRACIELLPKPEVKIQDATKNFLDEFELA
jgi:hypothetical protein